MSARADVLEGSWRRVVQGDDLDCVLLQHDAGSVREELRMAVSLHAVAVRLPAPDAEIEWERLVTRLGTESEQARSAEVVEHTTRRRRPLASMLLAASLSLLLAAGLSIGAAAAAPGSGLYPFRKALERMVVAIAPDGATVRLRIAEARLDDLMTALRRRDFNLAPGLSGDLVAARRAAASVGASTTSLDERIARDVPPMLAGAPDSIQRSVRGILGTLLPPMVDARRTEPADQVFGSDHPTGAEASSAGDVDDQGQERDSDEGGGDDPEEEADGDDPQGPPEEGDDDEGPDPDDDEGDDDEGDDEEGQDPEDRD